MSICRWIGRWQVPTWMPPHQGLTQLLAWGGDSFLFQSFCILYIKQIKGLYFGTLFLISVFLHFTYETVKGVRSGGSFLVSTWDLFLRPGSPRSPRMPLARRWRRSLWSTLSTWLGGIRKWNGTIISSSSFFSDQPIQFGVYFFNNIVDLAWR